MALIEPFKGILYNPQKINGDDVMAPPYDIITPEFKEALYDRSPYNIVRIDFGKDMPGDSDADNKYIRAKGNLRQWTESGVLARDKKPYFYAYEADYTVFGKTEKLKGIIALVKIDELGKGVYPHEATYSKPKADRLNLMRACNANVSPIYALYNSPERVASGILDALLDNPWISARDADGAVHKISRIEDFKVYESIIREFSDKAIYIADGHHRYEVAIEFKEEMRKKENLRSNDNTLQPYDYVMMFLANIQDEGITVLPTHRLIKCPMQNEHILKKLESNFEINSAGSKMDITDILMLEIENAIGLYMKEDKRWYILKYKGERLRDMHPSLSSLDVVVLHELIFKRILEINDFAYEMNSKEAVKMVRAGDFDAAFFLKPTDLKDVEQVALANKRMPPKSTYFYPKLLTGMVINSFR
jgi:uncharacterized protein (DUF1015 family)